MPADLNDYFKKRNGGSGGNNNDNNDNNGGNNKNFNVKIPNFDVNNKKLVPLYVLIIIVILLVIAKPFTIINSGELGIKATAGKFAPNTLEPGLHFFIPIIQDIIVLDAKVRMISYSSTEQIGGTGMYQQKAISGSISTTPSIITKEAITVKDTRGLDFDIDLAVQYQLNRDNAPNTIAKWGLDWENKIIDQAVREVVREIAGKYNVEYIPQRRSEFADEIKAGIESNIQSQEGNPVTLRSVQLRETIFPKSVKEQIEKVQLANQQVEITKNEVKIAEENARKLVAQAQGEANAAKTKAQGVADALKIEADAKAYANKEIAKSLTNQLLDLRQIETQAKFNEALKENQNAQIFLTPGGAVPNIWIDSKSAQRSTAVSH